jgi:hypothetical protein
VVDKRVLLYVKVVLRGRSRQLRGIFGGVPRVEGGGRRERKVFFLSNNGGCAGYMSGADLSSIPLILKEKWLTLRARFHCGDRL